MLWRKGQSKRTVQDSYTHNAWVHIQAPKWNSSRRVENSLWQTSCLCKSCVFLVICVRFCTDLLPSSSGAAGYIHIRLVGQVPANRSCNQRTKRHFTPTHYRGFPWILQTRCDHCFCFHIWKMCNPRTQTIEFCIFSCMWPLYALKNTFLCQYVVKNQSELSAQKKQNEIKHAEMETQLFLFTCWVLTRLRAYCHASGPLRPWCSL